MLVLNCHSEIYVWVGRHSSIDSKQSALDLGLVITGHCSWTSHSSFLYLKLLFLICLVFPRKKQEFIAKGASVGQVHLEIPIYVITEGCEPPFFTRFFEWDSSKANVCHFLQFSSWVDNVIACSYCLKYLLIQMLGNSFERKLAILKGKTRKLEVSHNLWLLSSEEWRASSLYYSFQKLRFSSFL